jgi:murein DD-endopeptidase MepM/ murein hydrolase activator NlpD
MKKAVSLFLTVVLLFLLAAPALADQLSDAQKKKSSVDSSISDLNKQKKDISNKIKSTTDTKKDIDTQKQAEQKALDSKQNEINLTEEQINEIEAELKVSDDNYNQKKELFKTRLRVMYENSNKSILETLLDSKNIGDFFARIELIALIAKKDKSLVEEFKKAKDDLDLKMTAMIGEKEEKVKQANDTKQTIGALSAKASKTAEEIKKYNNMLKELEDQIDKQNKIAESLAKDVYKLQQKGLKYSGGSMMWPLDGYTRVGDRFGMRMHPILKKWKLHTGIDISASSGTPIMAVNKGTVIVAGWNDAYGYTIVIDHGGGIATRYAHASKLLVRVGDKVSKGEVIAKVGSTGYSTGPHLHFEVIKNGTPIDPLDGYVSP